jgi:hypothetical protein
MKADGSELTGLEAVKAQAEQWRRETLVSVSDPGRLTGKDLTQIFTYVQTCDRFAALCDEEMGRDPTVTLHQLHQYAEFLEHDRRKYAMQAAQADNSADDRYLRGKAQGMKEALEFLGMRFPIAKAGMRLGEDTDDSE